jgi:DNA-binding IclR family transcriptional regulator
MEGDTVTERPPTGDATGPSAPRVRGRKPSKGDPVVHRALSLLDAFSAGRRSMNLAELSHRSGLPTSTTLRLATRLMEWGALERLPGGDFVIGLKLWEIASLAPRGHGLRDVAMPYLSDLAEATRQHVLLAVRDGTEAMLVERLSAHHAMDVLYRVGGRLPLHSTGVGQVLLAYAEPEVQEAILAQSLVREPEHVPVSTAALRRTLSEIRSTGLCTFRRTVPDPLVSVAAPIRNREEVVVAAISVVVPEARAEPQALAPAVRATARAISRALGAGSAGSR